MQSVSKDVFDKKTSSLAKKSEFSYASLSRVHLHTRSSESFNDLPQILCSGVCVLIVEHKTFDRIIAE